MRTFWGMRKILKVKNGLEIQIIIDIFIAKPFFGPGAKIEASWKIKKSV